LLAESIIERIFLNLSPSKAWPRPKLKKIIKWNFKLLFGNTSTFMFI
jgi:hypothetical protein